MITGLDPILEIKRTGLGQFSVITRCDYEEALRIKQRNQEKGNRMIEERSIGTIGNYFGKLIVKEEYGKYWWGIEGCTDVNWQEIPKSLYDALIRFDKLGMEGAE